MTEELNDQVAEEPEPTTPTGSPWLKALKSSPTLFANTSAVSFNLSDISIVFGQQFDNAETNLPGARVVMSHENFLRHMELLLPYYRIFSEWYGANRPSLPDIGAPGSAELVSLIERVRNTNHDSSES